MFFKLVNWTKISKIFLVFAKVQFIKKNLLKILRLVYCKYLNLFLVFLYNWSDFENIFLKKIKNDQFS